MFAYIIPGQTESVFSPITCVKFSTFRPTVFAAGSRNGYVYIFDLMASNSAPVTTFFIPLHLDNDTSIDSNGNGIVSTGNVNAGKKGGKLKASKESHQRARVTSISFNRKQRNLLAVADDVGRIHIWNIGWELSSKQGNEEAYLNQLGNIKEAEDD